MHDVIFLNPESTLESKVAAEEDDDDGYDDDDDPPTSLERRACENTLRV